MASSYPQKRDQIVEPTRSAGNIKGRQRLEAPAEAVAEQTVESMTVEEEVIRLD